MRIARDFIVKHSKLLFPVIIIAAVAVTVTVALNVGDPDEDRRVVEEISSTQISEESEEESVEAQAPLVLNEDAAITGLITDYYNAMAAGDSEKLLALCDEISDKDMLRYMETAKYTSSYPMLEIYTKPGPEEGSTIAYVYYKVMFENQDAQFPGYQAHYICTNEQGELYIKRAESSQEVKDYIIEVSAQDDVVEFNNRINVEYNELMLERPELLEYLSELDSQVSTAVGEGLAQLAAAEQAAAEQETGVTSDETAGAEDSGQAAEAAPAEETVLYATANTTVNVRSSDSEQADKLGKVVGGQKIQVLEQRVNGWSKVLYEGKEGFIKSEFLKLAESAEGAQVIGTVTAKTNVNARVSPSETAERLGVITGGDSVELVATEGEWCKIIYGGQVAYVKAEYVE